MITLVHGSNYECKAASNAYERGETKYAGGVKQYRQQPAHRVCSSPGNSANALYTLLEYTWYKVVIRIENTGSNSVLVSAPSKSTNEGKAAIGSRAHTTILANGKCFRSSLGFCANPRGQPT